MKDQIIKILKIIIPIGIGVYLFWYFLSGLSDKDIEQSKNAFFTANYFWVVLGMIVSLLSHVSRAYRWLFLLEPLGYKPRLVNSYHAVMSGYVINFTVPRSGEIARAGLLASYEKVPFEKGFATIVIERVIDVLMLGGVVLISGMLQVNNSEIKEITSVEKSDSNWLWYIIGVGVLLTITGFILYLKNQKIRTFINEKIAGFWEGLKSIWTMKKKWPFIFHTFFIWACYVGGIWIFAQAFPETAEMSIGCVFAAFVVGAAAIAILPGGIGAYPAWITAVLALYNIDFAAYGIFVWVIQTVMLVVLGLLSLFLIQRQEKFVENNPA